MALGGNALLKYNGIGTASEQVATVRKACRQLVKLLLAGHEIAITHGNGPQVGDILLRSEMAKSVLPQFPLDVCGAESDGMLGYIIQQSLYNELKLSSVNKVVVTVLTQTIVDAADPAFRNPTKPVGPFYSAEEASRLTKEKGWALVSDSRGGFRRVVPSPSPLAIVEESVIKQLFDSGVIVIAAGGGGIPVTSDNRDGELKGVEAVIDKDLTAALLATTLGVELLLILTDVNGVYLNYGTPKQELLGRMTAVDCRRYLDEGQFPAGSMGPKVGAALHFVETGGKRAIVTSLELMNAALEGRAGTSIVRS